MKKYYRDLKITTYYKIIYFLLWLLIITRVVMRQVLISYLEEGLLLSIATLIFGLLFAWFMVLILSFLFGSAIRCISAAIKSLIRKKK